MENKKDKNKNLQAAEAENETSAVDQAAFAETQDNAQMVSLADLMRDRPQEEAGLAEKPESKPEPDTAEPDATDTPDAERMEIPVFTPQEPEENIPEPETLPEQEKDTPKAEKPVKEKWTSLFRKPRTTDNTAAEVTPAAEPDTAVSAREDTMSADNAYHVDMDLSAYAPAAEENDPGADTFSFVSETPIPEAPEPDKKEKKKREKKDRARRNNKEEKRAAEDTVELVPPVFPEENELPETVAEEIPEETSAEPVLEKKKREEPVREPKMQVQKPAPEPGTTPYLCKMVLTLTVICVAIAALLAVVNAMTKDVIAENAEKKRSEAILAIFPEGDNVQAVPEKAALYYVFAGVEPVGFCANVAPNGYGGAIQMMVGMNADGTVRGVRIVEMSETSGVGSKAGAADFLSQFYEKSGVFAVGDNIDGIAGATISSKAVTEGVNMALALAGFVTVDETGQYVPVDPAAYPVISLTPVETEPAETDEIETEPVETETETETETTPPETETETETVPPETETETETVPPETTPPETRPPETTPPETRPPETTPPETMPPETTPPETTPPETTPPETTPPETETETNPPETETETNPPETETETETETEPPETEPETETETETEQESETETETTTPQPSRPPARR